MDASYLIFNPWGLDPLLSGANQNEEEYDSKIVLNLRNANLAGYTDSLSTGGYSMDAWVNAESVDPVETHKQHPYNNGSDPPFEEANLQEPEMFGGDFDSYIDILDASW
ncbi:hypothetical protein GGI43DRAFT_385480 [Trichoderma evansii]